VTGLGILNLALGGWEIVNFKKTVRNFQLEWQGEKSGSEPAETPGLPHNGSA
jgi:hypothetical protein